MRATLNGIVSADDDVEIFQWFGYAAFSPRMVRDLIRQTPEGEELTLEVNSGGGSVMAGSEIYSVLKASPVRTVAEVQSLAASAASYLCLGCDEVCISPVAQMMIHLPSAWTEGDRTEHLRSVQMLDSTREAILNAYEIKAGGKADRAELRRMMNAETWLTAQQALELGLADSILGGSAGIAPQNVMNTIGMGMRALGCSGIPDIAELRALYAAERACAPQGPKGDPGSQAPQGDAGPETVLETKASTGSWPDADKPWQAQARLDLEKIRFDLEVNR